MSCGLSCGSMRNKLEFYIISEYIISIWSNFFLFHPFQPGFKPFAFIDCMKNLNYLLRL